MWRRRYGEFGFVGLPTLNVPGRPPVYGHDDVLLLVKTVTEPPPDAATRWTMEAIAARISEHGVPISASQVWRICRSLDFKPRQTESWMTPRSRVLGQGRRRVGLHFVPPDNAIVWSVDEKSGIQATSRLNPTYPAVPGHRRAREFEYRRHGTAVVFAGLDVHDGDAAGWVTDRHDQNFVAFLATSTPGHPSGCSCTASSTTSRRISRRRSQRFSSNAAHLLAQHPDPRLLANQVELLFSILERRLLRYGEFNSVDDLADRIIAFINDYNRRAKPFRWTYDGRPLKVVQVIMNYAWSLTRCRIHCRHPMPPACSSRNTVASAGLNVSGE